MSPITAALLTEVANRAGSTNATGAGPVLTGQPRSAQRWARVLLWVLGVAVVLTLTVHHYGNRSTWNQGYALELGSSTFGVETVGAPGPFAQVVTSFGTLTASVDDGASWCPAGDSDVECGS